jgi:CRISPR-associated protein Cas2
MRLIVFFDLPMISDSDKREYTKFRKFLIKNGFIMMQQSVYSKLVLNNSVSSSVEDAVRKNLPARGLIEMLKITEKQYGSIEYLRGKGQTMIVESDSRLVEI